MGLHSPKLFAEIEKQSAWLINEGNPQDAANTAWACATLGVQSLKLFAEIEKQSAWLIKEGNPQDAANTAWACTTLGVQSPKLFAEIKKTVRIRSFTPIASIEDEDEDEDEDESVLIAPNDKDALHEESSDLSTLTVVVLKEKLRKAGLPVSGRKAELVERLINERRHEPYVV
jgi:hypothetical protein